MERFDRILIDPGICSNYKNTLCQRTNKTMPISTNFLKIISNKRTQKLQELCYIMITSLELIYQSCVGRVEAWRIYLQLKRVSFPLFNNYFSLFQNICIEIQLDRKRDRDPQCNYSESIIIY